MMIKVGKDKDASALTIFIVTSLPSRKAESFPFASCYPLGKLKCLSHLLALKNLIFSFFFITFGYLIICVLFDLHIFIMYLVFYSVVDVFIDL